MFGSIHLCCSQSTEPIVALSSMNTLNPTTMCKSILTTSLTHTHTHKFIDTKYKQIWTWVQCKLELHMKTNIRIWLINIINSRFASNNVVQIYHWQFSNIDIYHLFLFTWIYSSTRTKVYRNKFWEINEWNTVMSQLCEILFCVNTTKLMFHTFCAQRMYGNFEHNRRWHQQYINISTNSGISLLWKKKTLNS